LRLAIFIIVKLCHLHVDGDMNPVPASASCQVVIACAGVAAGYLRKSQLSEGAFVLDKDTNMSLATL
jgi:hypothetical protein